MFWFNSSDELDDELLDDELELLEEELDDELELLDDDEELLELLDELDPENFLFQCGALRPASRSLMIDP